MLPQGLADGRVVGDPLRRDVVGAREGVGHGLHPLVGVEVVPGGGLRGRAVPPLVEQQPGQGLQPLLPGHRGPGAALLLIRAVEVLHLRQGGGPVDGGGQLVGELALLLNGFFHRLPALRQPPQILEPVGQGADQLVVHGAVEFLAVAGDKGDGVALVQEGDDVLYVLLRAVQLPGQYCCDGIQNGTLPFVVNAGQTSTRST